MLESDYVSYYLNNWIDLIFGYKQKGQEAEKADNIFQETTYDDFNYDSFSGTKKANFILQIIELGQTPKKLFNKEHPQKRNEAIKMMSTPPEDLKIKIKLIKEENEKLKKALNEMQKEDEKENELLKNECKQKIQEVQDLLTISLK